MKDLFNTPNKLTLIRIIVSPFFLLIIKFQSNLKVVVAIFVVFIAASITDFFDGYLARKYNKITKLGQILDPIADKLMIAFALFSFAYIGAIEKWIVVLILFRDFSITFHRFYMLSKGKIIAATNTGKWKVGVQIIMIIIILLSISLSIYVNGERNIILPILKVVEQFIIWFCLGISVISGIEYFVKVQVKNAHKTS